MCQPLKFLRGVLIRLPSLIVGQQLIELSCKSIRENEVVVGIPLPGAIHILRDGPSVRVVIIAGEVPHLVLSNELIGNPVEPFRRQ